MVNWPEVVFIACVLVYMPFWIWMLLDCANHETGSKVAWVLIVLFASCVGAVVYYC
jgi:hypothetical protein